MAISPYTKPAQQRYIPTGVDPRMMMMMMGQQNKQQATATAAEQQMLQNVLKTQALPEDEDALKERQQYYQGKLSEIYNQYQGNPRLILASMNDLNKEFIEDSMQGDLKDIGSRYATRQKRMKMADAIYQKGDMTGEEWQEAYRSGTMPQLVGDAASAAREVYPTRDVLGDFGEDTYGDSIGTDKESAQSNINYNAFASESNYQGLDNSGQAYFTNKMRLNPSTANRYTKQYSGLWNNIYGSENSQYLKGLQETGNIKDAKKHFVDDATHYYKMNRAENPEQFEFAFANNNGQVSHAYTDDWNDMSQEKKADIGDYQTYEFRREIEKINSLSGYAGSDEFMSKELLGKMNNSFYNDRKTTIDNLAEGQGISVEKATGLVYDAEEEMYRQANDGFSLQNTATVKNLTIKLDRADMVFDEDGDPVKAGKIITTGKDKNLVDFEVVPGQGRIKVNLKGDDNYYYMDPAKLSRQVYERLNMAKKINELIYTLDDEADGSIIIPGDTREGGKIINVRKTISPSQAKAAGMYYSIERKFVDGLPMNLLIKNVVTPTGIKPTRMSEKEFNQEAAASVNIIFQSQNKVKK